MLLFLARVWGNWYSHSLLVVTYIGTISFEGNLTISMDRLMNICIYSPRNLATRMLVAILFIVVENTETSIM